MAVEVEIPTLSRFRTEGGIKLNDSSIINLMKTRPDKALYEAISKYERLLTAVVSRILASEQDVEECVADAFVGVWKHMDNLTKDNSNLKGYLICSARNNAINRYHKNNREKSVPQSDTLELLEQKENMEEEILDSVDMQVLLALIEVMEEPDREIMIRKHFLLEPCPEIADRLHMKPHQIRYRLQRGKDHLREALLKRGIVI